VLAIRNFAKSIARNIMCLLCDCLCFFYTVRTAFVCCGVLNQKSSQLIDFCLSASALRAFDHPDKLTTPLLT